MGFPTCYLTWFLNWLEYLNWREEQMKKKKKVVLTHNIQTPVTDFLCKFFQKKYSFSYCLVEGKSVHWRWCELSWNIWLMALDSYHIFFGHFSKLPNRKLYVRTQKYPKVVCAVSSSQCFCFQSVFQSHPNS